MLQVAFPLAAMMVLFPGAPFSQHGRASPAPATPEQRAHLEADRFQQVAAIRGLPLGVREALQALFGSSTLDIADPGGEFPAADESDPKAPRRRLVAAACSIDHCLVYYERRDAARSWRLALFHWTPGATRFEGGGSAPRGLRTIADLRRAILSNASTRPVTTW